MTHSTPGTAYVVSLSNIPSDGRVLRHCRALAAAGWRVVAVGLPGDGDADAVTAGARPAAGGALIEHVTTPPVDWSAARRIRAGLALFAARGSRSPGTALALARQVPGVASLSDALLARLKAEVASDPHPRLVVANDWTALPAALAARARLGLPFHYDTHEIATEEHAHSLRWRLLFPPLVRQVEREGLADARSASCVSPGIALQLREDYGLERLPHVVMSLPDTAPLAPRPAGPVTTVLYHGIFTPNRGIERLIASVPLWPEPTRLVLRGKANAPAYQRRIAALCAPGIASGRIVLEPLAPAQHILASANACDLGVFLPDLALRQNRLALPNKLFEYLYAGIVPVVPAATEMANLLRNHGAGLVLDEPGPESLARAIGSLTPAALDCGKEAAHAAALALERQRAEQSVATLVSWYSKTAAKVSKCRDFI